MNCLANDLALLERALAATGVPSSDFDLTPGIRPRADSVVRPAAVLVPLVGSPGGGLRVVLTRRAARLAHHPGQVAFPGGKQEPGDASPAAAALREAEEEIGLPRETVQVLGTLESHQTITSFRVVPVVGLVAPGFQPRPEPGEVAEVFEVPLDFLLDLSNYRVHARTWAGVERRYLAVPYGPHYIWGATARILRNLAERVREPWTPD